MFGVCITGLRVTQFQWSGPASCRWPIRPHLLQVKHQATPPAGQQTPPYNSFISDIPWRVSWVNHTTTPTRQAGLGAAITTAVVTISWTILAFSLPSSGGITCCRACLCIFSVGALWQAPLPPSSKLPCKLRCRGNNARFVHHREWRLCLSCKFN